MNVRILQSIDAFGPLILRCLNHCGAQKIAEFGFEPEGISADLAAYCANTDGQLTIIEADPQPSLLEWCAQQPSASHMVADKSSAAEALTGIGAWVIHGDNNYYKVRGALQIAATNSVRDRIPLLVFVHGTSWPFARRDHYRSPGDIPQAHRQPFSQSVGVTLDNPGSSENHGWRPVDPAAWALEMGGPGNGVLTAVEDFLADNAGPQRPLALLQIPAVCGLGVVIDGHADWADELAAMLLPYHENELLAAMEADRISGHLAAIHWRDLCDDPQTGEAC